MNRLLKIALAASASVFCLFYAVQNLVNLDPAFGFVQLMVGMEGHEAYPSHFGPAIRSPIIIWLMLTIIIVLELAAGALAGKGAIDMWKARNDSGDDFNSAKKYALAGTALAVFIWFGIFSAIGGAYFQMWQTEAGGSALANATWFSIQLALVWLLISQEDS
jgi:predicted small integral membrane protein